MGKLKQLAKARNIKRTLGTKAAAGFMRNRNFTLEQALWNLCYRSAA